MALPKARSDRRVLTASAAAMVGRANSSEGGSGGVGWQEQALKFVDQIPELNYASRFYARMLNQLRLYPAKIDGEGKITPVTDSTAVRTLERIRDPGGGRTQLLGRYGKLMMITGEGLLFGCKLDTDDEGWMFVWKTEVEVVKNSDGSVRKIIHKPNGTTASPMEYGPNEAVAYRMWTPHPARSGDADSPMRSSLGIANELVLLTAAVAATASSRTTNPILFMPLDSAPPPVDTGADEDAESDPFMSDLVNHLVAQKENVGTAEAAAPFVAWIPGEQINYVKTVNLHDTQNDYAERELRKEAVERLARGIDFPAEALLGLGSTNHWASLQILQDMWKSHGVSIADQFVHDLGEVYFRPALRDAEVEDWREIVIAYDASKIVTKPDRSDDAKAALELEAIGPRGFRELLNIPDDMAPTADELREMRARTASRRQGERPAPDPAQGPPMPGPEGDSGRRTRVTASAAREFGAAEMALQRCREVAGNRIRNKSKGNLRVAEHEPAQLVASLAGPDTVASMRLDPRTLVDGGTEILRSVLVDWGYSTAQVDSMCEIVELYAARTLFDRHASLPAATESRLVQMKEPDALA